METDPIYTDTVHATDYAGTTGSSRTTEAAEIAAKRLVLAGIGAAATVIDRAEDRFERFVDRGQRAQEELQEKTDELKRRNAGTRTRARGTLRSFMDVFLDTLNVPSKGDMDTINVKLNILTRKIDNIQVHDAHEHHEPSVTPPRSDGELAT
ncbi:MAG: phasin family protein [Chloroflexota bacterium]